MKAEEAANGRSSRSQASEVETLIDLFAGAGGGSIGFAASGFVPRAAIEIDPLAAASYRQNLGIEPICADIRSVSGEQLLAGAELRRGELTLLFGCPPCQSFTVLRRGAACTTLDERRNSLPAEYLRLVSELLPRFLAFENVPGMVEGRWASSLEQLLAGLASLGYAWNWAVFDAADFGVPQRRRRLLLVAGRDGVPKLPTPSHGGLTSHVTVREAISSLPALDAGQVDPTDPMHRARRHSSLVLERLRHVPEGGSRMDLPARLQLDCHRGHDGHYDIYGRMSWDQVAPTLTSGCTNPSRGRFAHPEQHRAITVREALSLQTFPARVRLTGGIEAMSLQVGNAVPPRLAEAIGCSIRSTEV